MTETLETLKIFSFHTVPSPLAHLGLQAERPESGHTPVGGEATDGLSERRLGDPELEIRLDSGKLSVTREHDRPVVIEGRCDADSSKRLAASHAS